ncbi:MAG: type 2 isopentenyl-diphosphate Delta-isomerase [Elusimicrobiota bacterium]
MIQQRKADHLRICAEQDVEFRKTTLLEDVQLVHTALAGLSLDGIDTSTRFMGRRMRAPLMISAISGGAGEASSMNRDLAKAAQHLGLAFCLGSQRPMLEDRKWTASYQVRRYAPDILILGNLGIQQAAVTDLGRLEGLVADIRADGLAIHLNPAQELAQPEGDRSFPDGCGVLRALTRRLPGRVMVKETGCGISREVGLKLKQAGVRVLDTAGAGGTSWPKVERMRSAAGQSWLDEWGIPTAVSLCEAAPLGFELVASGGLRSGLDVAKCLVLGADAAGMALPVLRAYRKGGHKAVVAFLEKVLWELKAVMLLTGAKDIQSFKKQKPVITGRLREWITSRRRR